VGTVKDDGDEAALDDAQLMRGMWELWKMKEMKQP
jgi:hypothetical protein